MVLATDAITPVQLQDGCMTRLAAGSADERAVAEDRLVDMVVDACLSCDSNDPCIRSSHSF